MKSSLSLLCSSALLLAFLSVVSPSAAIAEDAAYAGDAACSQCHESICKSFLTMAPAKANPSQGFPKLLDDFTEDQRMFCYHCHVTGAGKPGGFVSFEQTPELGHVGCETCHGPGARHAESGDPEDIIAKPEWSVCISCHDGNRVPKPNIYGRPHASEE